MAKVFDSWDSSYKSKFGALSRGDSCKFMVRIPKTVYHDLPPIMVIFRTGFKEHFLIMNESGGNDEYTEYTTKYTAGFVGVYYYYFTLVCGGNRAFVKRKGFNDGIIGEGDLFQLTVYEETFKTPDFIKGGIMYQIFPDRFCKSDKEHKNVPTDRVIRENWGETPFYRPDEHGHVWNNDYFGGDLEGVIQKLNYIKSLGVTCIYLNPIFEAHENHRYNTANYRKVDPSLGTEEDFKRLCAKAHEKGINVILDGVFSHTGADSIYFNKFNRYNEVGAYNSKDSEFFSWYTFMTFPDLYEAWWGINTLPNVNENNEQYTEYICGEGGVLDYWISLGADGYRLDVADELPDEFLDNLHKAVKRNGGDKLIIGEVWEDASNKISYGVKRRYLLGNQLDSTMNYPFRDAIMGYVLGMNSHEFENKIMTIMENYPKPSIDSLMNFVSTHDTERAINLLGGDSCTGKNKDWQAEHYLTAEQYELGKNRLKCAMVLQFFLPGVPSIYYGDEVGVQGYKDPFNRRCYPWGSEDVDLLAFVREISKIRRRCDLFKEGNLKFLFSDANMVAFSRFKKQEKRAIVIILNRGSTPHRIMSDMEIVKQFSSYEVVRGEIVDDILEIAGYDYAVVKVET